MRHDPSKGLSSDQYWDELRRLRWDWHVYGGLVFFLGAFAPVVYDKLFLEELSNVAFLFPMGLVFLHYICRLLDENRLSWRVRAEPEK